MMIFLCVECFFQVFWGEFLQDSHRMFMWMFYNVLSWGSGPFGDRIEVTYI